MKTGFLYTLFIFLIISITNNHHLKAQCQNCTNDIKTINIDLSDKTNNEYLSSAISRNGQCCGNLPPNANCVRFVVKTNPEADKITLSIDSGDAGRNKYTLNCEPSANASPGNAVCLPKGNNTVCLLHCGIDNPGPNNPEKLTKYKISTEESTNASPPVTLTEACERFIYANGYVENSIEWNSVSPGSRGDYNNLLSCVSDCDTTSVNVPDNFPEAPITIKYEVEGEVSGCNTPHIRKDTVAVTIIEKAEVTISPDTAKVCEGETATLEANATKGAPSYQYEWNTGETTKTIEKAPGTYWVKVTDQLSQYCPASYDTAEVISGGGVTVDAGSDQVKCADDPDVKLNASVSGTSDFGWSTTGSGTFSPNDSILDPVYESSQEDIDNGFVSLILTASANGCEPVRDTVNVAYDEPPQVDAGGDQVKCENNPETQLNGIIDGGSETGKWSTMGSGTFSPDDTTLNAVYEPSQADIDNGSVKLELTSTNNPVCKERQDTMEIFFTPAPTVDAGNDTTLCETNTEIKLDGSVSGADGGKWSTTGDGNFDPDDTTLNASYVFGEQDTADNSVTLILTTTGNGNCNPEKDSITITLQDKIMVDAGGPYKTCLDNPVTQLDGSVSGSSATGEWSTTGDGTFDDPNDLNTDYNAGTNDQNNGSVDVILTSTNNGVCKPVNDSATIEYLQEPVVDAGTDTTICSDDSANLDGTISGGASEGVWTTSGTGKFVPDSTTLDASYVPSAQDSANGSVDLTLTSTDGCAEVSDDITVDITPAPHANAGDDQFYCKEKSITADINGSVSGNTSTGEWSTNGSGSFNDPVDQLDNAYELSNEDINNGGVELYLTTTNNGICDEDIDTLNINVISQPVADAGNDTTQCANNIQLNGNIDGGTNDGKWTALNGTGTFSPDRETLNAEYIPSDQDISNGLVDFELAALDTGTCDGSRDTVTVTISPAPVVDAGEDTTLCENNATLQLDGSVSGGSSSGEWQTSGSGTFDPDVTTLDAEYIPSDKDINNDSVKLVLTSTNNGKCLAVSDTITLYFEPSPAVDAGNDKIACKNNAVVSLDGKVGGSTNTGKWSTSGSGAFDPDATALDADYKPSQQDLDNESVELTLTSTNNGNCNAVEDSLTITYTASPQVDAGKDQTKCENNAETQLNGSVSGGTDAGVWSTPGSGDFNDSTSLNATYFPSGSDLENGSVQLVLTSVNNGGCKAVSDTMEITFTPAPTVDAGNDTSVCANNSSVELEGEINGASEGEWTTTGDGSFSNISSDGLMATYNPGDEDKTDGSVILILSTKGSGSCDKVSDSLTLKISPAPQVDAGGPYKTCEGDPVTQLSGSVTGGSNDGEWSTNGTGTFDPDRFTLDAEYQASAQDTSDGMIDMILTSTNNGKCLAETDSTTIEYLPLPVVDAGNDDTVCANDAEIQLDGSISGAESEGKWTSTGSGVFMPSDSVPDPTYVPSEEDTAAGSVTLILTATEACAPVSDSVDITINPAPQVDAGEDRIICDDKSSIQLNGNVFGGTTTGEWSTNGNGTFDPDKNTLDATYQIAQSDFDAGSIEIYLTSTNNGLCKPVIDTMKVDFVEQPVADAGNDTTLCGNNVQLNGSISGGSGTGKWNKITGNGSFSPDSTVLDAEYDPTEEDLNRGFVELELQSTNNGNCDASRDTIRVDITAPPMVEAGNDTVLCETNAKLKLNAEITGGSGDGQWSTSGSGFFDPDNQQLDATYFPSDADKDSGQVKLTITTINNGKCKAVSDSLIFNIISEPQVDAGGLYRTCLINPVTELNGSITGGASGGFWETRGDGSFKEDSTINTEYFAGDNDSASGSNEIILTTISKANCPVKKDTATIKYEALPVVDAGSNDTVCANNATVQLDGSVSGGASKGAWVTGGDGQFNPSDTILNPAYQPGEEDTASGLVTLTLSSVDGCTRISDNLNIKINTAPYVDAGEDRIICEDEPIVKLKGKVFGGTKTGTWSTTGAGFFSPDKDSLKTTYIPGQSDLENDSIKLMLTSTNNGLCLAETDTVKVEYISQPVAKAGNDTTQCANNIQLNGKIEGGKGTGIWEAVNGNGTLEPDSSDLNANYIPTQQDVNRGSVKLALIPTQSGNCEKITDTVKVEITPSPSVNAGSDTSICKNNPVVGLDGKVNNAGSGVWSTMGSGSFIPDSTSLSADYQAGNTDISNDTASLVLTSVQNGKCLPEKDTLGLGFFEAPEVDAGTDKFLCPGQDSVNLKGTISGITEKGKWTTMGSGNFGNANALNTAYYPGEDEISNNDKISLILTSVDNISCDAVSDTLTVNVTSVPTVDAGNDQEVCNNTNVDLDGSIQGEFDDGYWSSMGGGEFLPDSSAVKGEYVPSSKDTTAGFVNLVLHAAKSCKPVEDTIKITFKPAPIVNAEADSTICEPDTIDLGGDIVGASGGKWSFSGSGSLVKDSTLIDNSYIPSSKDIESGKVTFVLESTGGNTDCQPTTDTVITMIGSKPEADFEYDSACDEKSFVFNSNSSVNNDSIVSNAWITEGQIIGNDTNKVSYKNSAGSYITELRVTSSMGCKDTVSRSVVINTNPDADFEYNYKSEVDSVFFSDKSKISDNQSINKWQWAFGDNDTANIQNPAHRYPSSGSYNTLLEVTTDSGCSGKVNKQINISKDLIADFNATGFCDSLRVMFKDQSVGDIKERKWKFGDNDSSNDKDPVHTYGSTDSYQVSLILESIQGNKDTANKTIIPDSDPKAAFNFTNRCDSGNIVFNNNSSFNANDSIAIYQWNFGNGDSDTIKSPVINYDTSGSFDVKLTINTEQGCTNSVVKTINSSKKPVAGFVTENDRYRPGDPVNFIDSSKNADSWLYDFDDEVQSEEQNPQHVYDKPGEYKVLQIVKNNGICEDTADIVINVSEVVVAVPSAFTPNNDGENDILKVMGGPFKEFDFRIFNQWGEELFRSGTQSKGWDGTYNGKKQPAGTYMYTLKAVTIEGKKVEKTGQVTILK